MCVLEAKKLMLQLFNRKKSSGLLFTAHRVQRVEDGNELKGD